MLEALSGLVDRSGITLLVVSATAFALATLEIVRLRHSLRRQRSAVAVSERADDSSREVESLAALAGEVQRAREEIPVREYTVDIGSSLYPCSRAASEGIRGLPGT